MTSGETLTCRSLDRLAVIVTSRGVRKVAVPFDSVQRLNVLAVWVVAARCITTAWSVDRSVLFVFLTVML